MTGLDRLKAHIAEFAHAEDGAVTVDWIVLTAALVMLGLGSAAFIASAVPDLADATSNYMDSIEVGG